MIHRILKMHVLRKLGLILISLSIFSCASTSSEKSNSAKSIIHDRIMEKQDVFRLCVLNARLPEKQADAFRGGTLMLHFIIESDGWVKQEPKIVHDSMKVPAINRCVSKTIQSIEFHKQAGGGTYNVSYPFHFRMN